MTTFDVEFEKIRLYSADFAIYDRDQVAKMKDSMINSMSRDDLFG